MARYVWCKTNTFDKKNIVSTVKHGGGSEMVQGCFAVSGPGPPSVSDRTMNSAVYQENLNVNIWPSIQELSSRAPESCSRAMSQNIYVSKSTGERFKMNKNKYLERPGQRPDLNLIEMLQCDLKRAVHAQKTFNVIELKQFCDDVWVKTPSQ